MTKRVRVENADTANHRISVQVWDIPVTPGQQHYMVKEVILSNPCDITDDAIYLTATRYLVIKELKE